MPRASLLSRGEDGIEASVTIQRAVGEVFRFYRDFNNLPSFLGDVMAGRSGNLSMDDTRPAGHSSNLDNKSDRGAHERVDPLRNGRSTRTENVLGNPFRPWIAAWCDRSSRSDESTSREIGTGRTCPDWKISGRRSVLKPAEVEGGHGNGKSD